MATITPGVEKISPRAHVVTWAGIATGDTCTAIDVERYSPYFIMAQAKGTFAGGTSIAMQGSLDGGTTWAAIDDMGGDVIALTAAGLAELSVAPTKIRPSVTAGTADSVTVLLLLRQF